MKKLTLALVTALSLAGCVTTKAPVAMGNDTYMIATNARGGFQSNSTLLTDTIQRANDFCAAMGRTAVVNQTNATGVQMWTPQDAQVVFRCEPPAAR